MCGSRTQRDARGDARQQDLVVEGGGADSDLELEPGDLEVQVLREDWAEAEAGQGRRRATEWAEAEAEWRE